MHSSFERGLVSRNFLSHLFILLFKSSPPHPPIWVSNIDRASCDRNPPKRKGFLTVQISLAFFRVRYLPSLQFKLAIPILSPIYGLPTFFIDIGFHRSLSQNVFLQLLWWLQFWWIIRLWWGGRVSRMLLPHAVSSAIVRGAWAIDVLRQVNVSCL